MGIATLIEEQVNSKNPINKLSEFLYNQEKYEKMEIYDKLRFVGYVLELGYDTAKIITSDTYKLAVGGIPRGTFLIMVPNDIDDIIKHFTLLRVKDVSSTPLNSSVQQVYFELHKKSMPELDRWTASELQWGALECDVLGMFYPDIQDSTKLQFSGDVNNIVSAYKYRVYSPDVQLLELIINGLVRDSHKNIIGKLRMTECLMKNKNNNDSVNVEISMRDFMGCRTAMFGKTRLGKSNVVKLIAQGIIDSTNNVGQVIFDINGEYANDNEQDGKSLRSMNEDRCEVYALNERRATPSKPLMLNFYELPGQTKKIISELLEQDKIKSIYIKNFASVDLLDINEVNEIEDIGDKKRAIRKIQIYWAILKKAGFDVDEKKLKSELIKGDRYTYGLNPGFSKDLRNSAYQRVNKEMPDKVNSLNELIEELKIIYEYYLEDESNKKFKSKSSGENLIDTDTKALLEFLNPKSGSGAVVLSAYKKYHSKNAGNFMDEILESLDNGKTIILDLGNANDKIRRYFSDMVSINIFRHQENKFVNDLLKPDEFIQLYFEEAHNLFPSDGKDLTGIYQRFAKEGAKFHIGMVYSTQSPSTINKELLIQTENFFVGHISSQEEVKALSKLQIAFLGIEGDILKSRTPGYMRILTLSHRFVVPVQASLYKEKMLLRSV